VEEVVDEEAAELVPAIISRNGCPPQEVDWLGLVFLG